MEGLLHIQERLPDCRSLLYPELSEVQVDESQGHRLTCLINLEKGCCTMCSFGGKCEWFKIWKQNLSTPLHNNSKGAKGIFNVSRPVGVVSYFQTYR